MKNQIKIKEFTKEEIPIVIANWLEDQANLEDNSFISSMLYVYAGAVRDGIWLKDLEDRINEN